MRHNVPWYIGFSSNRPDTALIDDCEVSFPQFAQSISIAVIGEASTDLEPAEVINNQLYAAVNDFDNDLPVACIVALRVEHDLEMLQAAGADLKQLLDQQGYRSQQWVLTSQCSTHAFLFTKVWYKEQSK